MTSRNLIFESLDDTTTANAFLARSGFVGELNRGFGSRNEEQAWNLKAGGLVELYRWGSATALSLLSVQEFAANTGNDIGFNPRSLRSEEALLLTRRSRGFQWGGGFFFRCKHDIDNGTPSSDEGFEQPFAAQQRVLVLRGAHAFFFSPSIAAGQAGRVRFSLRGDYNLQYDDWRTSYGAAPPPAYRSRGGLLLGFLAERGLSRAVKGYARGWIQGYYFTGSPTPLEYDARGEVGLQGLGAAGAFSLFAGWERFYDDHSGAFPQGSTAYLFGFRIGSRFLS